MQYTLDIQKKAEHYTTNA